MYEDLSISDSQTFIESPSLARRPFCVMLSGIVGEFAKDLEKRGKAACLSEESQPEATAKTKEIDEAKM